MPQRGWIVVASLTLAAVILVLAAPLAWRAARLDPVDALRYE